jgi:hypothetical protein
MRQHPGLSKADLVEENAASATGSDQMAHPWAIASVRTDENIVESGFARYIIRREISPSGPRPAALGRSPATLGIFAAAPGDAIG